MPLIAFEGLDQSGKQTQARLLGESLLRRGGEARALRVEALTFPDDSTPIGRELRAALDGARDYTPDVTQLLFVANRYEHRAQIEHWLSQRAVVICDRYLASSVAYGEAQGLDPVWLADLQRHLPQPALTILLDIAPDTAIARKREGRDRFERDADLLARVRESYLRQARQPDWVVIHGVSPRDDIAREIRDLVATRLGLP
jgi:dTMP kinase